MLKLKGKWWTPPMQFRIYNLILHTLLCGYAMSLTSTDINLLQIMNTFHLHCSHHLKIQTLVVSCLTHFHWFELEMISFILALNEFFYLLFSFWARKKSANLFLHANGFIMVSFFFLSWGGFHWKHERCVLNQAMDALNGRKWSFPRIFGL